MGQKYLLRRSYLPEKKNFNRLEEKKEIIYEMLAMKDLEETIACIVDVFPRDEPMTKSLSEKSCRSESYP